MPCPQDRRVEKVLYLFVSFLFSISGVCVLYDKRRQEYPFSLRL